MLGLFAGGTAGASLGGRGGGDGGPPAPSLDGRSFPIPDIRPDAVVLWATFQLSVPTVVYLVIAAALALGVLLTLASVTNTFFWSYWTLAYLRLRAEPPGEMPA